jgi:hypothetical protein
MERQGLEGLVRQAAHIPGSTLPVEMARLGDEGAEQSPALSAIVWFPPAWERPSTGSYPVEETVVVWEGDLTVSGVTVSSGEVLWVPAGAARSASSSRGGARCFARFSGLPRWRAGTGDDLPPVAAATGDRAPSPLGGDGRPVDTRDGPETWLLAGLRAAVAPRALEIFAPDDRMWVRAEEGDPLPDLSGRCWVLMPR